MNHVLAVAKRELWAFFRSPIAIIFLGVYLVFTLITFFGVEKFFARNIADLRPLFTWLPVLLILLCSALTMRQWSEEQKMGTLEVLLTLPVRIHHLVLGKFLASLALVAVALALTIPVPVIVSTAGDLDWGPVIGGYVGALLLAGAYLSIGLYVSSHTDNQIVSLIVSVVVCGLLWFVGSETFLSYFGNQGAEFFAAIGTGSRFESIRRGVLDLRDLIYYGTLIATFLTLNAVVLSSKGWSDGQRTRGLRTNARATAFLVAVNAVMLNVVMAGVTSLRVDLTERGEYSTSEVTKRLVRGLSEPLLIRGYFSDKTHPLLAPLVPRIRDMIEEYGIIGGENVRTEYLDPRADADVEKEANQLYGIKSQAFEIADVRDIAVVNSYFSILVKYGDQYEVLEIRDLIDLVALRQSGEVKLQNLEYDLTSSIKKVAYGFETADAVFQKLNEPAEFTAFITPDKLPENFGEVPATLEKVLEKLKGDSSGKFEYKIVDPEKSQEWTPQKIFDTFGLRPSATSILSTETFYFHLILKTGDRYERIAPAGGLSEADLEKEIIASLKRGTPGFLKTVGLAKPETPDYSQLPPQIRQQMPPPPPDLTRFLTNQLSETFTVEPVNLKDGKVSSDVDVLMVHAPANYDEKQAFAVDQHLMKGGTVLIFGGRYELDIQNSRQGPAVKAVTTGLEDILSAYGLRIEPSLVLDPQNEGIPQQVPRDVGGLRVIETRYLPYPFFPAVRSDGMASDNLVLAGLPGLVLPWASPIVMTPREVAEGEDGPELEYTELLKSTAGAWTQADANITADYDRYPEFGFAEGSDRKERVLAAMVTGAFESAFKGKAAPDGVSATILDRSPASARLVVVASSTFVSDVMQQLSRQAAPNFQLAQNLVDWGLEDTDLLSIRSRGTAVRTLAPLTQEERTSYILATAGLCLLGLVIVIIISVLRSRTLRPIVLDSRTVGASGQPQEVSS